MGSKYSRKLQQEEAATLTRGVHKHLPAHQHKNYGMKLKYEIDMRKTSQVKFTN